MPGGIKVLIVIKGVKGVSFAISRLTNMNTKTNLRQLVGLTSVICAIIFAGWKSFGMGSDWPTSSNVNLPQWPLGISNLVNSTNRVHAYWWNTEEFFFFSGSTTNFTSFLQDYSKVQGIEGHRLIVHDGIGEAKSPWDKAGQPCDWKIYGRSRLALNSSNPALYQNNSPEALRKLWQDTNYVLEVHFWTGGHIALGQVTIPQNVEVKKDK